MNYSVAIRTLGTSLDTLKKELISLHKQSILPEKIVIYIAKGYKIPDFRIGMEEYVYVNKGMIFQRALPYNEINSELILLLDDDVELAPDSAEKLLNQMQESNADCMAVDTFYNHKSSTSKKIRVGISSWVLPRFKQDWAFKLHPNGAFSYINNPKKDYYPSQSAAGPASMWKKQSFLSLNLEDEKWLEEKGFAFLEDELTFYKLHVNGGKLFVSFSSGIVNLDGKSASGLFQRDSNKLYLMAYTNTIRWHRIHYTIHKSPLKKASNMMQYASKVAWIAVINGIIAICKRNSKIFSSYIKGIFDGISYIHSDKYRCLPAYKSPKTAVSAK